MVDLDYRGTSLIRNSTLPLGSPKGPRHSPTVGSLGEALFYERERGTPVIVRVGGTEPTAFLRAAPHTVLYEKTVPTSLDRSSKQAVSTHQVSRLVIGRDQSVMNPTTTPSSFFCPKTSSRTDYDHVRRAGHTYFVLDTPNCSPKTFLSATGFCGVPQGKSEI